MGHFFDLGIDTCRSKCDSIGLDISTQTTHNKGKTYYVYHVIVKKKGGLQCPT